MNYRTTIFLLLILAIAGGIALYDNYKTPAANNPTVKGQLISSITADDVQSITITDHDGNFIDLDNKDGDWTITQPIAWKASFSAGQFLEDVFALKSTGVVDQTSAAVGLSKPQFTIQLQGEKKKETIKIGSRAASGNLCYVQVGSDSDVNLATGSLVTTLFPATLDPGTTVIDSLVAQFRDRQLSPMSRDDVRQIRITRPDGTIYHFARQGDRWQLIYPQLLNVDDSQITPLLTDATEITASSYLTPNSREAAAAHLDKPAMTVWLSAVSSSSAPATTPSASTLPATLPSIAGQSGVTIAFASHDPVLGDDIVARLSNPAVDIKLTLTADEWKRLAANTALDYRDRKILQISPDAVQSITVISNIRATTRPIMAASHTTIEITRKPQSAPTTAATASSLPPSDWSLKTGADAQQSKVNSLLQGLAPLQVTDYLPPNSVGGEPDATYALRIKTPDQEYDLAITRYQTKLYGQYQNLLFTLPDSFISQIAGSFVNRPDLPPEPQQNQIPQMPMGQQ